VNGELLFFSIISFHCTCAKTSNYDEIQNDNLTTEHYDRWNGSLRASMM